MRIQCRCEHGILDETNTEVILILVNLHMPGAIDCVVAYTGIDTLGALEKDFSNQGGTGLYKAEDNSLDDLWMTMLQILSSWAT